MSDEPKGGTSKSIGRDVAVGVITAAVLGIGTLLWTWLSNGGPVHLLGGLTKDEIGKLIEAEAARQLDAKREVGPSGRQGDPGASASIPRGAVVAFATDSPDVSETKCPTGWVSYTEGRGRFIVVAGKTRETWQSLDSGKALIKLTNYTSGDLGGEEQHTLLVSEMPIHRHKLDTLGAIAPRGAEIGTVDLNVGVMPFKSNLGPFSGSTQDEGGGKPHNIIPPYVALYYCKKN